MRGLGWVLGLSAVLSLTLLPSASYAAALPLVVVEWGLSATEAGFVFSAYQIGYAAATLVLLPLTDRVDSRWLLIVAAALSAAGNALFPLWASDFASGSLLRFLAGLALVGVYIPGMRVIATHFPPERRGGPVGLYVASFYVGTNLSVLLTGLLLPALGWRGAYLATVGLAAVAPTVGWLALRRRPATPAQRASGRLDPAVLRNRPALLAMGGYAAHTWELYAARGWIVPFLAAALLGQGYAAAEATALGATLAGVAFVLGAVPIFGSGFLSDRFGRTRTAGCFLGGSALCSLTLGWLGGWPWWALLAVTLLYGLCLGADSPIYSTAVTELAEPARLGSTLAVHSFLGFLAGIAGPVAFGALLDLAGPTWGWGLGFGQAGVVALLGVAALVVLRRHPAGTLLASGKR
ncbi:MAG: MFS transporter [Chloroflexi bacterium]|nr:MFS transporter [Chloroflexota bacterium]